MPELKEYLITATVRIVLKGRDEEAVKFLGRACVGVFVNEFPLRKDLQSYRIEGVEEL